MNILITGANGFIGNELVKYLSKTFKIIAAVRKIDKKKKTNLDNVKYIKFCKKELTKIKKISLVIHCASQNPPQYTQVSCYKNNTKLDDLIIDFIKKKKIRIFFFMSSMSVYGKKKNQIVIENDTISNQDLYGKAKNEMENKLKKISLLLNISVLIFRLSAVVGKNCKNTFLSNLYNNFLNKKNIEIYNPDDKYNGCVHVENLCKFIKKQITIYDNSFDIINIASSRPLKLKKIINMFKKKFKPNYVIYSKKKSRTYIVNATKARLQYNFFNTTTEKTVKKFLRLN